MIENPPNNYWKDMHQKKNIFVESNAILARKKWNETNNKS